MSNRDMTWPTCRCCDRPATCVGRYEIASNDEYGCDTHCGHGNEDGWCVALPLPEGTRFQMISKSYRLCAVEVETERNMNGFQDFRTRVIDREGFPWFSSMAQSSYLVRWFADRVQDSDE